MARVDASMRTQHDANARVIRELNLPGCSGSRFAPDLMRLVHWEAALPMCLDMARRIGIEQVWRLLKYGGLASRLQDPAFTDSLNTWLAVLGPAGFVTFMCGGVAARLVLDE